MSSEQYNPCLQCDVNQKCCSHLSGLRLSKKEFEKYFKNHSNVLSVLKYNKLFLVSSDKNGPCPYWGKGGCLIYNDRPVDCRLYPYEITQIKERRDKIDVTFRVNPGCSQKDNLLLPVEEAKALIKVFCQKVYGSSKPFFIRYSLKSKSPSRFLGIFDPVIARISKIIRTHR